jgi:hypothetical protein
MLVRIEGFIPRRTFGPSSAAGLVGYSGRPLYLARILLYISRVVDPNIAHTKRSFV